MQQTAEQRLQDLLILQLGSQILQMCELQAKLDTATAELAAAAKREAERTKVPAKRG